MPETVERRTFLKFGAALPLAFQSLHALQAVGAGAAEGAVDAANILKPSLSRGELQTIGATTQDDYRKYIERDPALERRFQYLKILDQSKWSEC